MSWEDEDLDFDLDKPVTKATSFSDEEDSDGIKESWDAESDDDSNKTDAASTNGPPEMSLRQQKKLQNQEAEAKKKAQAEEKAKEIAEMKARMAAENEELDDPVLETARRQRLVEEADLELAMESLGVQETSSSATPASAESSALPPNPKTRADFEAFGHAVAQMLKPHVKANFFSVVLDTLMRDCTEGMSSEELRKISTSLGMLASEKQKNERSAKSKKKAAKKTVKVERDARDTLDDDNYTTMDEMYDFM
jgi:translation initiation factor 3 subunit J